MTRLSKDDKFYEIKASVKKFERKESLDSLETFDKKNKRMKKKRTIIDYAQCKEIAHKNNKIKSIIDFDEEQTNCIKSLAIEKKSSIALTTRFMKEKMLIFAKTSLRSFVYDIIDVFCYSDDVLKAVYSNYQVKRCFLHQNLTDTDGTSLTFVFICDHGCKINEKDPRKIIFEVLIISKIINHLDLSGKFWDQYAVQNKNLKNQFGLYEIESIDNPNILPISVNPKEYFEKCRDQSVNKKNKGLKKIQLEWILKHIHNVYLLYMNSVINKNQKKIKQKRFQIINCGMRMVSVNKTQFAGLNDKRFYFHAGIVSLPYGHYL